MIKIENLTKKYGSKVALDNVNLEIPKGEIIGLFGENGAGKTTLMKSVFGFISHKGNITLDGEKITTSNIAKISFATAEHTFFQNLSPKHHRDFYSEHFATFSDKRFNGLMEFFSLPMNKKLKSFSLGQKNQFEVIMALSQGAEYVFMDEPFAGNDIFNREDFYKVLSGILTDNETVILSTHLIEEVSDFIGRAILLQNGKILGNVIVSELEEQGLDLISYLKNTYNYREDRVSRALENLTDEEV